MFYFSCHCVYIDDLWSFLCLHLFSPLLHALPLACCCLISYHWLMNISACWCFVSHVPHCHHSLYFSLVALHQSPHTASKYINDWGVSSMSLTMAGCHSSLIWSCTLKKSLHCSDARFFPVLQCRTSVFAFVFPLSRKHPRWPCLFSIKAPSPNVKWMSPDICPLVCEQMNQRLLWVCFNTPETLDMGLSHTHLCCLVFVWLFAHFSLRVCLDKLFSGTQMFA